MGGRKGGKGRRDQIGEGPNDTVQDADDGISAIVAHHDQRMLRRSELERLLEEAYAKLRASSDYTQHAERMIGDFWDTTLGRAPFIEDITFRQLLSIKVQHLIEKHTFTEQKAQGILRAIDACLGSTAAASPAPRIDAPRQAPRREIAWRPSTGALSPVALAAVSLFETQWMQAAGSTRALGRLIAAVPSCLSQLEYALLWLETEYPPAVVATISGQNPEDLESSLQAARGKFVQLLGGECSEVAALVKLLSRGSVSEKEVLEALSVPGLDPVFQLSVVRMLLLAVGGRT
jgi:hypothetical protein